MLNLRARILSAALMIVALAALTIVYAPTPEAQTPGSISIPDIDDMNPGDSISFTVSASSLRTLSRYKITVTVSGTLRLNDCSSTPAITTRSETLAVLITEGSMSSTLHGCKHPGGTVTATLCEVGEGSDPDSVRGRSNCLRTVATASEDVPVADLMPTFGTVSIRDKTWRQNMAITAFTLPEATGGDGALTYSLSPALPAGVTRNSSTRRVSGTPTGTLTKTEYTWTVSDADGDTATRTFNITIDPDLMPTFGASVPDKSWRQNTAITAFTLPAATGGDGTLTYSLSPALPTGVTLNTATRRVSGTPTVTMAETTYTWKVTDADGDTDTETFTITITPTPTPVPPPPPVVFPTLSAPSIKVDSTGDAIVADYTLPQNRNFHYVASLVWPTCVGGPQCTTQDTTDKNISTDSTSVTFTRSDRPPTEMPPYHVGVKACTTASRNVCGPFKYSAQSVGQLDSPEIQDVVPMELRRAQLTWGGGDDADTDTRYSVQAKYPGAEWANVKENAQVADGHEIALDDVRGGMGLDNHEVFSFQVIATDSSTPRLKLNSEASDEVKIVDNPILAAGRANGSSTGGSAQVSLKWAGVSGTEYTIKYRKLGGYSFIDHSNILWPNNSEWPYYGQTQSTVARSSSSTVNKTISVNEMGGIYAFQVNYTESGVKVFSARDAYAWPSDGVPTAGSRVGTYPFFGYWSGGNYRYTVCTDTFPTDVFDTNTSNTPDAWKDLIVHAFEQWELAAPDLLTVTHQDGDCLTEGSPIDNSVPITSIKALYNESNEVYMVDRSTWGPGDYIDVITNNRLFLCMATPLFPGPPACVISTRYRALEHGEPVRALDYGSVDVLVNGQPGSKPRTQQVDIPGEDTIASYRDTRFNQCHKGPNDDDFFLYDTMVHEAGHALGLSYYWDRFPFVPIDSDAHSTIPDSVMNYDSNARNLFLGWRDQNPRHIEPDCSPHPFDIMAIEALYQTVRSGGDID